MSRKKAWRHGIKKEKRDEASWGLRKKDVNRFCVIKVLNQRQRTRGAKDYTLWGRLFLREGTVEKLRRRLGQVAVEWGVGQFWGGGEKRKELMRIAVPSTRWEQ